MSQRSVIIAVHILSFAVLAMIASCHAVAPPVASPAIASACATGSFAAVQLQKQTRPSIVRIESDRGAATGFVIKHGDNSVLIATNYHVIRGGTRFDAILDSGARLGNVQVVKVDVDHDLALLKSPGLGSAAPGLTLSAQPVVLAEHIAALGYPYVSGEAEPSLTFEDGRVTAARSEMDGQTFIRTNANINPGNSGGPVIDACGQVVGIVVAILKGTERTGLIIPIDQLRSLVVAHDAPRGTPEAEIASRIRALETAVRYKRGKEVAAMFSRHLLAEDTMKAFTQSLEESVENATTEVNAYLRVRAEKGDPYTVQGTLTITDYHALSPEERIKLFMLALNDVQRQMFMLYYLLSENKIDAQTAMTTWLGLFAHEMFGQDPTFRLDRVTARGKNAAHSQVMVGGSSSSRFYEFDWVYEWGDWRIDTFNCARGCG